MVLTHTNNHSYSHPFPTVTLAFFLRYCSPQLNPFSSHVLSTDTISSHVDSDSGRLHTTRIHLKRSRVPTALAKILPTSVLGGSSDKSSYVLENSVVDIKQGWMRTESRNLNFTGVLSVVESQHYSTSPPDQGSIATSAVAVVDETRNDVTDISTRPMSSNANTYVTTVFSYRSTLGNRKTDKSSKEETRPARLGGWISGWGAKRIQGSIEAIASNKTDDQLLKSRDGMRIVLERLRANGVVAVLRDLGRLEGKSVF